jgi:hypothetical protein
MAHFAELDENNVVLCVLVIDNSLEDQGADFLSNTLGLGGTWIQTSYNGNIHKNFAGIGYKYDNDLDAFIPPKCHEEAILDLQIFRWECPNDEHQTKTI